MEQASEFSSYYKPQASNESHTNGSAVESVAESVAESVFSAISSFESSLCSFQANFERNMQSINSTMESNTKAVSSSVEDAIKQISMSFEKKIQELAASVEKNVQLTEKNTSKSTSESVELIIKSATQLYNSIASSRSSRVNDINSDLPKFDVICNSCYSSVRGQRWRCETCEDFDLCSTCKCHITHHPDHKFKLIKDNFSTQVTYTCDFCNSHIVGIRQTCTACPDFDLCYSCFGSIQENHPPNHTFVAQLVSNEFKKPYDTKEHTKSVVQHSSVVCDHCDGSINGIRYKCGHCPDYDLCEKCEEKSAESHTKGHIFLKIRDPIESITESPLLPRVIVRYGSTSANEKPNEMADKKNFSVTSTHQRQAEVELVDPVIKSAQNNAFKSINETLQAEYEERANMARAMEAKARKDFHLARPLDIETEKNPAQDKTAKYDRTQTSKENEETKETLNSTQDSITDENKQVPTDTQTAKDVFVQQVSSEFLADLNIPDGTLVAPKKSFIKMWKVKNNGNTAWPAGSRLLFNGGGIFKPYPTFYPEGFVIPSIAPGEEACITAELQSPDAPGSYSSLFCFTTPEGTRFGDQLWCSIKVAEEQDTEKDHSMIYPTLSTQDSHSSATSTDQDLYDYLHKSESSSPALSFKSHDFIEDGQSLRSAIKQEDASETKSVASDDFFMIESKHTDAMDDYESASEDNIEIVEERSNKSSEGFRETDSDQFSDVASDDSSVPELVELPNQSLEENKAGSLHDSYTSSTTVKLDKEEESIPDDFAFRSQLIQLHEMGFSCDNVSMALLYENEGKVDRVITQLLESNY
ncbi:hypothetical protein BY458DRAFT_508547 [Sporodiniella umbellata]|nr:hypothetical protein BY458DRAFT_508547 [Sporodiniella umbellata]